MLAIASRVPDHGRLAPWRFILYRGDVREEIGASSPNSPKSGRDRLPKSAATRRLTRFSRAPLVIGVVSSPKDNPKIPRMGDVSVGRRGGHEPGAWRPTRSAIGTNWITNWYSD